MTTDKTEGLTTNEMYRRMEKEEHEHRFGRDPDEEIPMWYKLLYVAFFGFVLLFFLQIDILVIVVTCIASTCFGIYWGALIGSGQMSWINVTKRK
jgi:hypothetical protein